MALMLVGSHNMTLAGFGFNRELTNVIRVQGGEDAEGVAIAQAIWGEIEQWLAHFGASVPGHVVRMVNRVKDFAPWLKGNTGLVGDTLVLASHPGARPLLEQLTSLVEGKVVHVALAGAFFDQQLRFLEQVQQILAPDRLSIAIDPNTVEIPARARAFPGASFVRAERLGVDDEKEQENHRYLHAKGILVELKDGGAVFASGSANPSAPAWLSSATSGNVELMLAYRGDRARATAAETGFTNIAEMPAFNESDWQTITLNAGQREEPPPPHYRAGLAMVEEDRIIIRKTLLQSSDGIICVLCDADGQEIARSNGPHLEGDAGVVVFPRADLTNASCLHVLIVGELRLKLLLHHARAIEEQARSGTQRRFREALLTLETETTNIELLIECIYKIVFSESHDPNSHGPRETPARKRPEVQREKPATLAIDVSDIKHSKAKQRLTHSGDFAYLLDALIYHLRLHEDKPIEEIDRFGRSEEEQIGADDDPDAEGGSTTQKHETVLDVCHARVTTVINRMVGQLRAYARGEQLLENVLIRLLAVLAVLRELRGCDGRVSWVEKGKTTVPAEQRLRLLTGGAEAAQQPQAAACPDRCRRSRAQARAPLGNIVTRQ